MDSNLDSITQMEVIWGSILGLGLPERWLFALGTFVVHEAAFVPLNAILFLCHHRGWLNRFKIQVGGSPSSTSKASSHSPGHPFPKARLVRECIFSLCVNHLVLQIPTLYLVYPAFKYFGMRSDIASLPDAWEMARHIAIFILINDTYVPPSQFSVSALILHRYDAGDSIGCTD